MLKKYRVSLCFMVWDEYTIEAETEHDALDKARDAYEHGHGARDEGELNRTPEHDEVYEEA